MRPAAALLALLLLAGCSSPAAPADEPAPAAAADVAPLPPDVLTDSREGTILYRLLGDSVSSYTGDPFAFCVDLPEGVLAVDFTLTWSDPRPLLLEFQDNNDRHSNWNDDLVQAMLVTSPSALHVDAPDSGKWQVWIGPPISDVARDWHLDIAWTVPAGMDLSHIEDLGYCP